MQASSSWVESSDVLLVETKSHKQRVQLHRRLQPPWILYWGFLKVYVSRSAEESIHEVTFMLAKVIKTFYDLVEHINLSEVWDNVDLHNIWHIWKSFWLGLVFFNKINKILSKHLCHEFELFEQKILSSFTHCCVVSYLYDFHSSVQHKRKTGKIKKRSLLEETGMQLGLWVGGRSLTNHSDVNQILNWFF